MTTTNPLFSRKFIISILALILAGIAFFMGKVSSQEFFSFSTWILGLYNVANVAQAIGVADPTSIPPKNGTN
jgi:hypothetical protein